MVRAKKWLGQHFLRNKEIAHRIVQSLTGHNGYEQVLEIGPGTGVLSDILIADHKFDLIFLDLDTESVEFLKKKYPAYQEKIIHEDFLKVDLDGLMNTPFGLIGNFPYNISSQIFFRILENPDRVSEVVCMLQKEVAYRIAASHGSKTYGILSVLLGAYYTTEILFDVGPEHFDPPPKVVSTVIRLTRNNRDNLPCSKEGFFRVVKQGFQNRRKTLRNALKPINLPIHLTEQAVFSLRAEQLTVDDFIELTCKIENGNHTV